MAILAWDGSLDIGHEKIDAQHKCLVELINQFHAACVAEGGVCDPKPTLLALYKYTLFHFNDEEALMDQEGYAFREGHVLEHRKFVEKLDVLAERTKAGDVSIGSEIFTWLVGWLHNHISVTDKRLADCLPKG
jgi:hemerythrin